MKGSYFAYRLIFSINMSTSGDDATIDLIKLMCICLICKLTFYITLNFGEVQKFFFRTSYGDYGR